ncbi:hypothetical protein ONE62_42465 (plasmid) [Rhodococcus opacus]|nr:hypothetical protein [Rhodococcus opacus]UZG60331.1 hypothetical protein ONE62_42465 [Rhodococcus opacus]
MAVVRLVNAELTLHHCGGEPDRVLPDPATVVDPLRTWCSCTGYASSNAMPG